MRDGNIHLKDLEFEYMLWKNRIKGYIAEIDIINRRNRDIGDNSPGKELNSVEIMVLEEHESQLKQLVNRINVQEQEMQYYNKDFPITYSHEYLEAHIKLREKMRYLCNIHRDKIDDLISALGI